MRILTFDIEEWFHILEFDGIGDNEHWNTYESRINRNIDIILELLVKKKQKATFFCLGWLAAKYPEVIKKIDAAGFEIASHSDKHEVAYNQSPADFENDLKISLDTIEQIIGKKINIYRAPGFSLTKKNTWLLEILYNNGIETDCSIFPTTRSHGGFKNFPVATPCIISLNGWSIKEFPMNTAKIAGLRFVYSGGGYFRLLPYSLIKKLTNDAAYVMTYFHPRDFDAEQPVLKGLSLLRKFKSYYGIKTALNKFVNYLNDFSFIDISTANKIINWDEVPKIDISEIK